MLNAHRIADEHAAEVIEIETAAMQRAAKWRPPMPHYVPPHRRERLLTPLGWVVCIAVSLIVICMAVWDINAAYFWNHGP